MNVSIVLRHRRKVVLSRVVHIDRVVERLVAINQAPASLLMLANVRDGIPFHFKDHVGAQAMTVTITKVIQPIYPVESEPVAE